jgi:hypothetical protein
LTETPQNLDWVKKRADCSIAQVFKELQIGVEQDVKTMNTIRHLTSKDGFGTMPLESNGFVVDEELEQWQVRKRALEALFFG